MKNSSTLEAESEQSEMDNDLHELEEAVSSAKELESKEGPIVGKNRNKYAERIRSVLHKVVFAQNVDPKALGYLDLELDRQKESVTGAL